MMLTRRHLFTQVTGQGGRVPRMNYNGHLFATKLSHRVGEHSLWPYLEKDGLRQGKTCKACRMMSTQRNDSRRPGLRHTTATDEEEWWTVQYVAGPNESLRA